MEPYRGEKCEKKREISDEQEAVWKEVFDLFDKNGDGHISVGELGTVIRGLGGNPTKEKLKLMIKSVDKDENGMIEYNDFKRLMLKFEKMNNPQRAQEELKAAFKIFDKDGNGLIDAKELGIIMKKLGERLSEDEVDQMVKVADKNGDGKIDYVEFVSFMCQPVT